MGKLSTPGWWFHSFFNTFTPTVWETAFHRYFLKTCEYPSWKTNKYPLPLRYFWVDDFPNLPNAGHVSSPQNIFFCLIGVLKTTTQHRCFISGSFSSSIRTSHIKNHYALRKLPLTVEWCKFPGVFFRENGGKKSCRMQFFLQAGV